MRLLAPHRVVIADGHHRYRTSLAYRESMRAAGPGPWDQLLMFLVDADLHGPSILPIHRLLLSLPPQAVLDAVAGDFEVRPAGRRPSWKPRWVPCPLTGPVSAWSDRDGAGCWSPPTRPPWRRRPASTGSRSTSRCCTARCWPSGWA